MDKVAQLSSRSAALLFLMIALVSCTPAAGSYQAATAEDKYNYSTATSLEGATTDQVGAFAQQYAAIWLDTKGQVPLVVMVRATKIAEMPELGLDNVAWDYPDKHSLWLVVMKGDFSDARLPSSSSAGPVRYGYVACMFNQQTAANVSVGMSRNGAAFRKLLNDPSLPDDTLVTLPPAQPSGPELPTEVPTATR